MQPAALGGAPEEPAAGVNFEFWTKRQSWKHSTPEVLALEALRVGLRGTPCTLSIKVKAAAELPCPAIFEAGVPGISLARTF